MQAGSHTTNFRFVEPLVELQSAAHPERLCTAMASAFFLFDLHDPRLAARHDDVEQDPSRNQVLQSSYSKAWQPRSCIFDGTYATFRNVSMTSRRRRLPSVAVSDCSDGGGKYRRFAGSSRERRTVHRSPAVLATASTIIAFRMNLPRTVFSPTTYIAIPSPARTREVSPTARCMSLMYRASMASCLDPSGLIGSKESDLGFRIVPWHASLAHAPRNLLHCIGR